MPVGTCFLQPPLLKLPYPIKAPEPISDQYKRGTSAHFLSVSHIILSVIVVYLPDSILKTAVIDGEKGSVRE